MSGDLDLARRLVAHPRFPGFTEPDHVTTGPSGHQEGRLPSGLLLRLQPVGIGDQWWWLPALDDAATAGVLLGMLPDGCVFYTRQVDSGPAAVVLPPWVVDAPPGDVSRYTFLGTVLGEAAARALLALWEASRG